MTISNNPSFSIVVNTIDRAGPLRSLLHALEHQSYPNFEVIVVVGPTKDNTLETLAEFSDRVRVLSCPSANLSQSRNIGLLAARGDIVAYIDDDAIPCVNWLDQLARIFQDSSVDLSGGAVWAAHPMFSMLQFRLGIYSALSEQVDVRSFWIDALIPPGKASHWVARAMGANLVVRRQALLDVNGFDEFYGFIAEETDLALRMARRGHHIHPVKEAVVYHFPASSRNRVAFTAKGRWWLRTRSRLYLGLKNALDSGETLGNIVRRSVRTSGANLAMYLIHLRQRDLSLGEVLNMSAQELLAVVDALAHGIFFPRRLIPTSAIQEARQLTTPILKFQNERSPMQPSVDPVSGHIPTISMPERPLRLCLLSSMYPPTGYAGVARLTHLMAKGLFELGHTVHVVTLGEKEEVAYYDGAYVHRIPHTMKRYLRYRHMFNLFATLNHSHNIYQKVKRLIMNDGIELVDSPLWQYEGLVTLQSGLLPVVVRLVTGLKQISEIHHSHVEEFALMGDLERIFLETAPHLMPNTQATLQSICAAYQLDQSIEQRCTIVPYGIVPAPEDQITPFDTQHPPETYTVLFVGRLEKRKGILDLFAAIPLVLKQFPQARFIIAGADNSESDGFLMRTGNNYPAYFASHYAEYTTRVEFTGMVSDEALQELYRHCDLFVAPSLYESFGLIYLEAMNYAKPVIGCRAGGIPEVVDDGMTGILVDPESPKALAEAIVSMLRSPQRLRDMGLAGRAQILERFNYLKMAENYARVYRRVISDFEKQSPTNSASL